MSGADLNWFSLVFVGCVAALVAAIGGHEAIAGGWVIFAFLTSVVWHRSERDS